MSLCPSDAFRMAASSAGRSRSVTTDKIERSSFLISPSKVLAKRALLRPMRPDLSTVAIAIGVFWKKRMKRTSAARCGSLPSSPCPIESERARGARRAIGAKRDFMKQAHGDRLAAARLRSRSKNFGLDLSGRGIQRGQQRRTLSRDDVAKLERARADLGEIVIEPGRQGRIEIDDVACGIDRKEPGRRMVEIIDGVLELLEDIFLPLALARNIGDRPHRHARRRVVSRRAAAHACEASGRLLRRCPRCALPPAAGAPLAQPLASDKSTRRRQDRR